MSSPTFVEIVVTPAGPQNTVLDLNKTAEITRMVAESSPQSCINVAQNPSVQVYFALKKKIESSDDAWLNDFLDLDGLESLLDSLTQMTVTTFTNYSDAIVQLDCVLCIRCILNRAKGLQYFVQREHYVQRLVRALQTGNALPKKHLYDILSTVCVYDIQSHQLVLQALHHYKKHACQAHRFSVFITELKEAESASFKTSILTTVNCVINCVTDVLNRCRIRNEFIGLGLLDVLGFLRKEELDDDLHIQLQVFHEKKHQDESVLEKRFGFDVNDPGQLFQQLWTKVLGTSKQSSFTSILQDLLLCELTMDKVTSNLAWETAKRLVHRGILSAALDKHYSAGQCLPSGLTYCKSCHHCCDSSTGCEMSSSSSQNSKNTTSSSGYPKSPSTLHENSTTSSLARKITYKDLFGESSSSDDSAIVIQNKGAFADEFMTSLPKINFKTLKWIPLMENDLEGIDLSTVWERDEVEMMSLRPSVIQLEELFSEEEVTDQEQQEHHFLANKTRMQLNLLLNRAELTPEEFVKHIEAGDLCTLTLSMTKYLSSILPSQEEISILRREADKHINLGAPERFILKLSDMPDYHTQLDGHLLRAEFKSTLCKLTDTLRTLSLSCREVLASTSLPRFLGLILQTGNILNNGKRTGSALGFKLESLSRLEEVKSSHQCLNLLSHLVATAQEQDKTILAFLGELKHLHRASSLSVEEVRTEICNMNTKLRRFVQDLGHADSSVQAKFEPFLEDIRYEFESLQKSINDLRQLSHKLAAYFCETEHTFNLKHCLGELHEFCLHAQRCKSEGVLIKKQQGLAFPRMTELRQSARNRRVSLQFGKSAGASSSFMEEKNQVLEHILNEVHRGNYRPRHDWELASGETDSLQMSWLSPVQSPFSPVFQDETPFKFHELAAARLASLESLTDFTVAKKHTSSVDNLLSDGETPKKAGAKSKEQTPSHIKRKKGHHRSKSDLIESTDVGKNWLKYHEIKKLERSASKVSWKQSNCMLTTLNLEDHGRIKNRDDVVYLEPGPIVRRPSTPDIQVAKKPPSRRTSIGNFFNKVSRAVLKPRHGSTTNFNNIEKASNTEASTKTASKTQSKHRTVSVTNASAMEDKENVCSVRGKATGIVITKNKRRALKSSNN